MKIIVTGANTPVGSELLAQLRRRSDIDIITTNLPSTASDLIQHNALLWTSPEDPIATATSLAPNLQHPFRFGYLNTTSNTTAEQRLERLTQQHPLFRATIFRPGRILPRTSSLANKLLAPIAIRVDHLALAMIEEATRNQAEHYAILNNSTLRKIADPSH